MPNFLDHVKMTVSGTPGTGTITLGAGVAGFQSFAGASAVSGATYPYEARDGDAWEVGWGVYTTAGTTLARTLIASSTGSLISLTSAAIVSVVAHKEAIRFKGARVRKSADETAANYTAGVAITWDAEIFDTDAWHDNATNNTRLTVPSGKGINYVELVAAVRVDLLTADLFVNLFIRKNGDANLVHASKTVESGNTNGRVIAVTGPVDVVAGDYFEAILTIETDTSVTIPNHVGTHFSIKEVG
jgi:hypothetical protein